MKFTKTYCSQCGAEFGAGDEGFSSCKDHALTTEPQQERRRKALAEPDQWKPYLKDGETPFERFVRDRADTDALLELYKKAIAAAQDQDAKDAARFRWLEQNVYQGVSRFSQVLWCIRGLFGKDGESFREAIDDAMYGTKK